MAKEPIYKFDPSEHRRPRRLEESTAEIGFPLVWVIIGILASLMVIGLVGLGVFNMVRQQSITPTPETLPAQIQDVPQAVNPDDDNRAVAPAGLPTAEPATPTPTLVPTLPPAPIPQNIEIGAYAKVANTDNAGVRVRPGPRVNVEDDIVLALEGAVLLVLDGPAADQNQEDYIWWKVRKVETNEEGWVVQDFIEPSQRP